MTRKFKRDDRLTNAVFAAAMLSVTFLLPAKSMASSSGESSYELSCRAKAKDIAADTYRTCVTENRNAEIERIRKDYQQRLRALKDDYEKELSHIGGKPAHHPAKKSDTDVAVTDVKSAPSKVVSSDDSQMDIPEPVPVEH